MSAFFVILAVGVVVDAPTNADEFLSQYEPQCKRVQDVYGRLRATWLDHSILYPGEGRWEASYLAWDDRARFVYHYDRSEQTALRAPVAGFSDPGQLLLVYRRDGGERIVVPFQGKKRETMQGAFDQAVSAVTAVYGKYSIPASEYTFVEYFRKYRTSLQCQRRSDGHSIEVVVQDRNPPRWDSETRVVFDTAQTWIPRLVSSVNRVGHINSHSIEFEYQGVYRNVPLVKSFRWYQGNPFTKEKVLYLHHEITQITPLEQPPNPKEFEPQIAGVAGYAPPTDGNRFWWLWWLLLVAVLLLAAETLRRRARAGRGHTKSDATA